MLKKAREFKLCVPECRPWLFWSAIYRQISRTSYGSQMCRQRSGHHCQLTSCWQLILYFRKAWEAKGMFLTKIHSLPHRNVVLSHDVATERGTCPLASWIRLSVIRTRVGWNQPAVHGPSFRALVSSRSAQRPHPLAPLSHGVSGRWVDTRHQATSLGELGLSWLNWPPAWSSTSVSFISSPDSSSNCFVIRL